MKNGSLYKLSALVISLASVNISNAQSLSSFIDIPEELRELDNFNVEVENLEPYKIFVPLGTNILGVTLGYRDSQSSVLIKYEDLLGKTVGLHVDSNGVISKRNHLVFTDPQIVTDELKNRLSSLTEADFINIRVTLQPFEGVSYEQPTNLKSVVVDGKATYHIDEQRVDIESVLLQNQLRSEALTAYSNEAENYWKQQIERIVVESDIQLETIQLEPIGSGSFSLSLKASQAAKLISGDLRNIARIDLLRKPNPTISQAVQYSGINDHARFGSHRGVGVGLWQSENACAADEWWAATPYDARDDPDMEEDGTIRHAEDMARVIRLVSPDVEMVCGGNGFLPSAFTLSTTSPRTQIINRSAAFTGGPNSYGSEDETADNTVISSRALLVNSAGNNMTGSVTGITDTDDYVDAGARGLNTLTVGNLRISSSGNATFVTGTSGGSKYKDSNLGNMKPELSAPGNGTYLPVLSRGTGGTSAAAAHTSGFLADLVDHEPALERTPSAMKALMMAGATQKVTGQSSSTVGVGGIDYKSASQNYILKRWSGNPGATLYEENIYLSTSRPDVTLTLAWLNGGTFALSSFSNSYDWDMELIRPNGSRVFKNANHVNPFEFGIARITTSGVYKVRITRFARQNTGGGSQMELSLAVTSR